MNFVVGIIIKCTCTYTSLDGWKWLSQKNPSRNPSKNPSDPSQKSSKVASEGWFRKDSKDPSGSGNPGAMVYFDHLSYDQNYWHDV